MIVGASNAVNLTDGLDGLAIMPVVMVGSALGVFAYIIGSSVYSRYLLFPYIPGAGELLMFCAAMAGAGLAFLWFNTHPAQVFMGDVGALSLGGALGTIAVITRQEIVLAIMGGIFVVEALSVMLQVSWFKCTKKKTGTGRRILLMAPLHHHFEKTGWTETPGRGPLLDHHDAAVPGRPGEPEAALMATTMLARPPRSRARPRRLGAGDGALVREPGASGHGVGLAPRRRTPAAGRRAGAGVAAGGAVRRAARGRRCSTAWRACSRARASRRTTRASRRCSPPLRRAASPVQGELDLFVQALAALQAERGYAPRDHSPSPAPTARRRRPR